ncbi:hypothetical protein [Pontibacter chitinilyticus]|uniref:hypothetical protein n=1 Tax=Pontibacter chitinilyticus TaxID=2674989 RepID=UPI00321A023B
MAKRYKSIMLATTVLLLALLMQYFRTGTWQFNNMLIVVLLHAAGISLALLAPASQEQKL